MTITSTKGFYFGAVWCWRVIRTGQLKWKWRVKSLLTCQDFISTQRLLVLMSVEEILDF